MHFIDKATALEGMRQRPHLARATLGVGVLIHIETQAGLSLTLLRGQWVTTQGREAGGWDLDLLCLKSSTSPKGLGWPLGG